MAKKKLLLIVNPVSGRMKISAAVFDIIKVFSDADYQVTAQMTRGRGDATDIVQDLGAQHDLIVLCGGDGTLNEGITGVLRAGLNIPIGYIPCGTTNDFANGLGLERDNLKVAAENIVNGKPYAIDIGKFGEYKYFSYIASFGAFTGTSYSVPQVNKNMLGHLAYVLEGIKDLPNIKPVHAKVIMEDVIIEDDFIFGSISNATSIGGVVKLDSKKVDFSDGRFEVVLVRNPKTAVEISKIILAIQTGRYEDCCINFYHAKEAVFEMTNNEPWALDGEYGMGRVSVNIKVLHNAINIIV
ncbi:MAG: YegS/Rv2252/BmrU family lipid kinase [Clostridiaceae bacterium]|nr:YegS/Rv2252/BmrU family lipid kinase [Clostridiaceae bacterium]